MPPQADSVTTLPSLSLPIPSSSTIIPTSTQESTSRSSPSSSTSSATSSGSSGSSTSLSSSTTSSTSTPTTIFATTRPTLTTDTTPGNVVTSTSIMYVTTASRNVVSPTSTVGSGGGSTPFLQNTGAVAGVFTVVGIVGLSLIFILARNFHRRRQQEAFDRDLQEATRQAAATSAGPFFDDDDDDPYKNSYSTPGAGVYGTADRQYSDVSHGTHGTYSQPPMAVDSYGMREISHPPGPGDMLYSSDPYSAGAAGIGVARARSVSHQPDYSPALKDGNAPYPAFAAPNPGHMPGGSGDPYAGTTLAGQNVEFLGAAGMGGHIGGALSHSQQYGGPYPQGSLEKNRGADGQYYRPNGYGPPGPAPAPTVPANRFSVVNEDVEDAYGGVTDGAVDHGEADRIDAQIASSLPNPFERDISEEGHAKDTDMESVHSGYSQEEEPKRILKVANE